MQSCARPAPRPADPTDGTLRLHRHRHDGGRYGPDERHALLLRRLGRCAAASSRAPAPDRDAGAGRAADPVTNLDATAGNFRVDLVVDEPDLRASTDHDRPQGRLGAGRPHRRHEILHGHRHVGRRRGPDERHRPTTTPSGRARRRSRRRRPRDRDPVDPTGDVTYTAAPTGSYGGIGANYTLGAVFHVTTDKVLRKLGRVYKAGSTAGNQIGIWDATSGALLARPVTPGAPTATLAEPAAPDGGQALRDRDQGGDRQRRGAARRTLTGLPSFLVIDDSAFIASSHVRVSDLPRLRSRASRTRTGR